MINHSTLTDDFTSQLPLINLLPEAVSAGKLFKKHISGTREDTKEYEDQNVKIRQDVLTATSKVIGICPEIHTMWNLRRTVILSLPLSDRCAYLKKEMDLLINACRVKSFCIWNHRAWVINEYASVLEEIGLNSEDCQLYTDENFEDHKDIEKKFHSVQDKSISDFLFEELANIDKLLKSDGRNIHIWTHRTRVLDICKSRFCVLSTEEVYQMDEHLSRLLILKDFSNYSAWRLRFNNPKVDHMEDIRSLVRPAYYTSIDDSSVWLYQEHLVRTKLSAEDLSEELEVVNDLIEENISNSDCILPYYSRAVILTKLGRISDAINDYEIMVERDTLRSNMYKDEIKRLIKEYPSSCIQ